MKTLLKIVNKIAKKNKMDLIELFSIFLANKVTNIPFEEVIKELNLDEKEKEVLRSFYDIVEEISVDEIMEFIDDCDEAALKLALFFTPFIDKEALYSKDAEKIRKSLSVYPDEIREVIIKTLEILSMIKLLKKEDKRLLLKEAINSILLLAKVIKEINALK